MVTDAASPGEPQVPRSAWIFLLVVGALTVCGGILALAYPDITLLVISLILGIQLLVFGALDIVEAIIDDKDTTTRVLELVLGLLGVIAGVVVLRKPGESLQVIVIVGGLYLLLAGIVQLIRAALVPGMRGMRILAGLAIAALGIVILAWPHIGLGTLAVLTGLAIIVRGLFAVAAGITLRAVAHAQTRVA